MLIQPEQVCLDVEATSFEDLIRIVASRMPETLSRKEIVEGVMQREALGSTHLCSEIAVPHVRLNDIDEVMLGFARLKTPRVLGGCNDTVHVIVLLLSPAAAPVLHLKALAAIARIVQSPAAETLLTSTDSLQIAGVFAGVSA